LKSKNLTFFPAPEIVQIVLKFDENPKDFPKKIIANMINEIIIPENHHDHGIVNNSLIVLI
jgi:hypothetical protein